VSKFMKLASTRLGVIVGIVLALIVVGAVVAFAGGGGTHRRTQSTAAGLNAGQPAARQTSTPQGVPIGVHKKLRHSPRPPAPSRQQTHGQQLLGQQYVEHPLHGHPLLGHPFCG
jgi:hypothetical protein